MNIKDIKPNSENPRLIKEEQFEKLKNSIKEDPQMLEARPLVIDENNVVLGGNMRLKALVDLGYTDVPVHKVKDWTPEQKRRFIVKDNLSGGEWDYDLLTAQYDAEELSSWGMEGLDKYFIDEPDERDDEVPESPEEPKSKIGDLYELGGHRVLCGDSTKIEDVEKLMNGQKADTVFTDPPYGMDLDADYTSLSWGDRKGKKYNDVIGDRDDFKPELITTIFENFGYCKEIFTWGADYYFDLIPDFKKGHYIVWDKTLESNGDAGSNSEYELLWTKQKHKRVVLHFNWFRYFGLQQQDTKKRMHPTQKPLQVCEPIIEKYTKENGIVVDLYLGVGSTLIACEKTGRKCYGMELDPKYVDVIVQRYVDFTGNENIKLNGEPILWKKSQ